MRASKIYLLYETLSAGLFYMVFAVNMVYFVASAKLNPLQLVLVGTALELSTFLFEIPTGVVADLYSRRLSVVIGAFLIGAGFVIEGLFAHFWPIVLAQVVWGLGYTFTSGALQAWISDETSEEIAGGLFLRGAQVSQWGALAGLAAGTLLGNLRVNLPIVLGGVLFAALGVFLIAVMPERGFHPTPAAERGTWRHMTDTLRGGMGMLRRRPQLVSILAIGLFFGLYSEGFDRLWTAHMLERFTFPSLGGALSTVTWFGLIQVVGMLLTAAATGLLQKSQSRAAGSTSGRLVRTFAACSAGMVACLFGFALADGLGLALGFYWAVSVLRQINSPLYTAWVNQRLDPQVRATVLSMSSQVDALGQIAGGPLVGGIAQTAGLRVGLLASSGLLAPVLLLFAGQLKSKADSAVETRPV